MVQRDCPLCGGTGWKTVERAAASENAQRVSLDKPGSMAQGQPRLVWAVPCDCTGSSRAERALAQARIPRRYEHCDFESFDTDPYTDDPEAPAWNRSLAQAKLVVEAFAREYPNGPNAGLLLTGRCGTGKTHLAVAALRNVILRGHTGMFCEYNSLLRQIQDSYNAENQITEFTVLEPILKTKLLIIDDLGSSKPSDWVREMVGHILNTRYNEQRLTILTTIYTDQASPVRADTILGMMERDAISDSRRSRRTFLLPTGQAIPAHVQDTLEDRLNGRIRSRLYEMCKTIEINAPDFRKEIRQAGRIRS